VSAAVLETEKKRGLPVPRSVRLTSSAEEVVNSDCDLVIEVIGGIGTASKIIRSALQNGKHVITANKALLADSGELLLEDARANRVTLQYSAAAGGAVPMLEAVRRIAQKHEITELEGVLNGTSNFVLDQLSRGEQLEEAVAAAQEAGFAEADPSADLNGTDAAQKLILLAHAAFGEFVPFEWVVRRGVTDGLATKSVAARSDGNAVRSIAALKKSPIGVKCSVAPRVLDGAHPLARVRAEENCLVVKTACGREFIFRGRGAGRWPTAEAVFADALALRLEQSAVKQEAVAVGGAA
jgi:homoserine dehydrogenase